ncbi:MAG: hypothetical protein A3B90_02915 [Candidatus Magasanikbacteria bacterium RIFCSPHIGHO2_02_FULL_41_13]|uniref:Sugar ABC transporter substrate-binding protein n=1 Tax=Candidatus Magasanikbacteria bacterium RIFCSPHIGHO2_02_FULL_41_13 TaxID=1798676 RepID=A0A1F6M2Y9_9BACT|nr:MAG: hypothetical protein A3B90_02915 [Candidatus Magasanikbacteria bacterium RIFCSPHIGHO2_02_FULL_41_13]
MRKTIVSFLTLTLLITGFGCKGLSADQQAAIKPVNLNYWTVYDNVQEIQRLAEQYKALHSYVTINVRQLRYDEYQDKFLTALADDVGPDIMSMHVRDLQKHATRLSPVPASVSSATIIKTEGFNPQTTVTTQKNAMPTVNAVKNNYLATVGSDVILAGKIYGLPLTVDTMALYYNKDLLDLAGIATPPSNWEEFLTAVKQATKLDANDPTKIIQSAAALGTANNIDNAPDLYAVLLMQKGIKIIDQGRVSFTQSSDRSKTSPAFESLRFYTDFARNDKEAYTWNETQANAFDEFVRGKSVFYFGFGFDYDRIKARAPQMNLAIAPMLQLNSESISNVASYWVETVPKKSKHQNEAWDFIRFISEPANIKTYSEKAHIPSALRVHNKDQKNDENPLSPFAKQVLQADNWYRGKDYAAGAGAFKQLITGYLAPLTELDKNANVDRDERLMVTTAQILQQTL